MTPVPTSEKFLECVQQEFGFLVKEFGFTKSFPLSPGGGFGQFEVVFHSRHVDVLVSGINCGYGVQVVLTPLQPGSVYPLESVPLWAVAKLRCPEKLDEAHKTSGQLAKLPLYAHLLLEYAADVLRGHFTILPSANAVVAEAVARSKEPKKSYLP